MITGQNFRHGGTGARAGGMSNRWSRLGRFLSAVSIVWCALGQDRAATSGGGLLAPAAAARPERQRGAEQSENIAAMNIQCMTLRAAGDYEAAQDVGRKALELARGTIGERHPDFAAAQQTLAHVLTDMGRFAEALTLYQHADSTIANVLGENHPARIGTLTNLARVHEARRDYSAAEPVYRKTLDIVRAVRGGNPLDAAWLMNRLAGVLARKGENSTAEHIYLDALRLIGRAAGEDNIATAQTVSALADILSARGDYASAERDYLEALDIYGRRLGRDDPAIISTLNRLGLTVQHAGDMLGAASLHRETLALRRARFGDGHPSVADSLGNLAQALDGLGNSKSAEPLLRRALDIYRQKLGGAHRRTAAGLSNLAGNLAAGGSFNEAAALFREALALLEARPDRAARDHRESWRLGAESHYAAVAARLARVLTAQGRVEEVYQLVERVRAHLLLAGVHRSLHDAPYAASPDSAVDPHLAALLETQRVRAAHLIASENALHATLYGSQVEKDNDALLSARKSAAEQAARHAAQAHAALLEELRRRSPELRPLPAAQLRSSLEHGELMLSYAWSEDAVTLLATPAATDGQMQAFILAENAREVGSLHEAIVASRRRLALPPARRGDRRNRRDSQAEPLWKRLIPAELRGAALAANRIVVLPDGPLDGLGMEAVLSGLALDGQEPREGAFANSGVEIVYAASAAGYVRGRFTVTAPRNDNGRSGLRALVLADPRFEYYGHQPVYPEYGVLINRVQDGTNASAAGMLAGDVMLSYDGNNLYNYETLVRTIREVNREVESGARPRDKRVVIRNWRDEQTVEFALPPGRMGVFLERGRAAEELQRRWRANRRTGRDAAETSTLDYVRYHGGSLKALSRTRSSARAVAGIVRAAGGDADILTGEAATQQRLAAEAAGRRIVHIATHAVTGSLREPLHAAIALTQPEKPAAGDLGFLTLPTILRDWPRRLRGCQLVVLSGSDSGIGEDPSNGLLGLPEALRRAGAASVIAGLWKVDETAAGLLLTRFYQTWLGHGRDSGRRSGKSAALAKARMWLRGLPRGDALKACESLGLSADTLPDGDTPFDDPHYWAAFVIVGNPD